MRAWLPLILTPVFLAGCGGGSSGSGGSAPIVAVPIAVEGAAQKGPFIVGSNVLINRLDENGEPTDSTILTQIDDSIGSFSFEASEEGAVQINASGYYFSELSGQISDGTVSLNAIYEVRRGETPTAYVNLMTHLINDRVVELMNGGQSVGEAIVQAEGELVDAFFDAMPVDDVGDFTALNVYDTTSTESTIGNAYLLAFSTAFYKYAESKAAEFGTAADAELTLILNVLADDLADNGQIETAGFLNDFVVAIRSLSPSVIAENLRGRALIDFPNGLTVPDISMFLSLCAGTLDCAWSGATPMPVGTAGLALASYDDRVFVFGGTVEADREHHITPQDAFSNVFVYEPETNSWETRSPMPKGSHGLFAHTAGDLIIVISDWGPNGFQNDVLAYDPLADEWHERSPKPTSRTEFASSVVDGKIYLLGGRGLINETPGNPWELRNSVEIYDPVTDEWTTGQSAPDYFAQATSCEYEGKIYVFGGLTNGGSVDRLTYIYDPVEDSWSSRTPPTIARTGHACARVGDHLHVMGGSNSDGPLDVMETYDPSLDSWSSVTRLPSERSRMATTVFQDTIILVGGFAANGNDFLDSVEILDPSKLDLGVN